MSPAGMAGQASAHGKAETKRPSKSRSKAPKGNRATKDIHTNKVSPVQNDVDWQKPVQDDVRMGLNSNSPEGFEYDASQTFSLLPDFPSEPSIFPNDLSSFGREDYSQGFGWDSIMMMSQDGQDMAGGDMMRTYSQNDLLNINPTSNSGQSVVSSDVFNPYSGPFSLDMNQTWLSSGASVPAANNTQYVPGSSLAGPFSGNSYQEFPKPGQGLGGDMQATTGSLVDDPSNDPMQPRMQLQPKTNKRKRQQDKMNTQQYLKREPEVIPPIPDPLFTYRGLDFKDLEGLEAAVNEEFPQKQIDPIVDQQRMIMLNAPKIGSPSNIRQQLSPQHQEHSRQFQGMQHQQHMGKMSRQQLGPAVGMFQQPQQRQQDFFGIDDVKESMQLMPGMTNVNSRNSSLGTEYGSAPNMPGTNASQIASREARRCRQMLRKRLDDKQKRHGKGKATDSQGSASKSEKKSEKDTPRPQSRLGSAQNISSSAQRNGSSGSFLPTQAVQMDAQQGNALSHPQVGRPDSLAFMPSKALHSVKANLSLKEKQADLMNVRGQRGMPIQQREASRIEAELGIFKELFRIVQKLSDPLRVCIRDSLLRLSESARGRANASNTAGNNNPPEAAIQLGSSEQSRLPGRGGEAEKDSKEKDEKLQKAASKHGGQISGSTEGNNSDNGSNKSQGADENSSKESDLLKRQAGGEGSGTENDMKAPVQNRGLKKQNENKRSAVKSDGAKGNPKDKDGSTAAGSSRTKQSSNAKVKVGASKANHRGVKTTGNRVDSTKLH